MMHYDLMSGSFGGGFMAFAWVVSVLVAVPLILGVMAPWNYVQKK